jgi:putative component of membrane protein insertase Oxa1/YidC/SpoIIIJ protein YidD
VLKVIYEYIDTTNCIINVILCSLFFIMILIVQPHHSYAYDDNFTPWDFKEPVKDNLLTFQYKKEITSNLKDKSLLLDFIKVIYKSVSSVDGDRCQMSPTCTGYSIQAIEKHGLFIGLIMTSDRLIHENNEMDLAPIVKSGNEYRFYDPVSGNDFWWCEESKLDK